MKRWLSTSLSHHCFIFHFRILRSEPHCPLWQLWIQSLWSWRVLENTERRGGFKVMTHGRHFEWNGEGFCQHSGARVFISPFTFSFMVIQCVREKGRLSRDTWGILWGRKVGNFVLSCSLFLDLVTVTINYFPSRFSFLAASSTWYWVMIRRELDNTKVE